MIENELTREKIEAALKEVIDPEIGINILDLGFIYGIEINDGQVKIKMTLTSPMCPLGGLIIEDIKKRVGSLEGVTAVDVELVFDPPWTPEKMHRDLTRL